MSPTRSIAESNRLTTSAHCMFCGTWPAALYHDIESKRTSARVCEDCVHSERVVKDKESGLYITNPEPPADPAEVPE